MRQPIFTKRGKILFFSVSIIATAILGFVIWLGIRDYIRQQDKVRQLLYSDLVTHQLASEWLCVPESLSKRKEYILSLMKRFAPDDFKQVELSHAWVDDYKSKQLAATLTVEQRAKLNTAYEKGILPWRTDISESDQWMMKISRLGYSDFGISKCIISPSIICSQEASFTVDNETGGVNIIYSDNYVQWRISTHPDLLNSRHEPNRLYLEEYKELRNNGELNNRIELLQQQVLHDHILFEEARERVSKMAADSIAAGSEEEAAAQDYRKYKCGF